MTPSTNVNQTTTYVPYTDHSKDYIPSTSPWNTKLTCSYQGVNNTAVRNTCCSDSKIIDRTVDKAYEHGVQSHLGIAAIQSYPCITQPEMSRLNNDLRRVIKLHGTKMDIPEGVDLTPHPSGAFRNTMQYCKEVLFNRFAGELGKVTQGPPMAFTREVLDYCKKTLRFSMVPNDPSLYLKKGWE